MIIKFNKKGVVFLKIKVYTLNAFGKTDLGGNPAGVVLSADNLNEEEMKKIAKEVGFSETAFIMNSDRADFKLRFFTPSEEVISAATLLLPAFTSYPA